MTLQQAIEILDAYNKWRRDNEGIYTMPDPKVIGEALDAVIALRDGVRARALRKRNTDEWYWYDSVVGYFSMDYPEFYDDDVSTDEIRSYSGRPTSLPDDAELVEVVVVAVGP